MENNNDNRSEASTNTPGKECYDHEPLNAAQTPTPEPATQWPNYFASQFNEFRASTERILSDLVKVVESRLAYDETKEKAFDRLYAELDQLKKDHDFEQRRPLFADLILLFDRLDYLSNESQETGNASTAVQSIREELIEILSRRGVDIISPTEKFDPAVQHALGTEETRDQEKNNGIARVVRRGFAYGSRVIRHEEVIVYRLLAYKPDPNIGESQRDPQPPNVTVETNNVNVRSQ